MVAGHLREKDGHYYCVLSYIDHTGKRKQMWKATGLPVKGNKKRAEEIPDQWSLNLTSRPLGRKLRYMYRRRA